MADDDGGLADDKIMNPLARWLPAEDAAAVAAASRPLRGAIARNALELGLSVQVEIPWPVAFIGFVKALNALALDLDVVSPECYAPVSYHTKFAIKVAAPFIVVATTSTLTILLQQQVQRRVASRQAAAPTAQPPPSSSPTSPTRSPI